MIQIRAPHEFERDALLTVFLAGSIEEGKAEHWQDKFMQQFSNYNIIFLNPRRENFSPADLKEQIRWELRALHKAEIIVMYFDPNTQSPISLLELGLYASSEKLFVCCPDGYFRKENVVEVCARYSIDLSHTIEEFYSFCKSEFADYGH